MAYLVLARKYRPERFSEVVGQAHITRTLANAIAHDRLHHAYMFCGIRGLGKTTVARILAKCLVCEQGPTAEPCNTCAQCVAVKEGRSTDVIEIDAASNNGVDDIRRLREQVHYLPQSARRKVYLIDEVHMLSKAAFNALLKTLEEPPPHVTFLFATTDPHKVLPTILSRVNRLDFRRVGPEPMVAHLADVLQKEQLGADEKVLRMISRASEGSVRDALTYLDEIIAFAEDPAAIQAEEARVILGQADRFAIAELVDAVLAGDPATTLDRFDEITRTTGDLTNVAVGVLQHFRDLAVVKATGQRGALIDVSGPVFEQLERQASQRDHVRVAQLFDRFTRAVEGLDRSASPRLVLEMALLDLAHADPVYPVGALLERIEALTRGGPATGGGRSGGGRGRSDGPPRRDPPPRSSRGAEPRARSDHERPAHQGRPPTDAGPGPHGDRPSSGPPAFAPTDRSPRASADATSTRPDPRVSSPETPAVQAPTQAPAASQRPGSLHDQLWSMMTGAGGNPPAGNAAAAEVYESPAQTPAAANTPDARASTPRHVAEGPPDAPKARGAGFELAAPPSHERDLPGPGERLAKADPEAGCPSSRCEPRLAIPWRELEPFAAWEALLERIRDEDELLFAVLGELGLAKLGDEGIELAAARGSFAREQLRTDAEIRARIEAYVRDCYGEALPLRFTDAVPALPELPSYKLTEEARRERHRVRIEHRARAHPQIRALVEQFGAQIERIEPLGDPPRD